MEPSPPYTENILFLFNHLMEDGKDPQREVDPFFLIIPLTIQAEDLEGLEGVPGEPA